MGRTFARCLIDRFEGKPARAISPPTTISCIDSLSGVLEVAESKTVPYVPLFHPFVERLCYETAYFTRLEYGDAKAVVDQVRFAGILKSAS